MFKNGNGDIRRGYSIKLSSTKNIVHQKMILGTKLDHTRDIRVHENKEGWTTTFRIQNVFEGTLQDAIPWIIINFSMQHGMLANY